MAGDKPKREPRFSTSIKIETDSSLSGSPVARLELTVPMALDYVLLSQVLLAEIQRQNQPRIVPYIAVERK